MKKITFKKTIATALAGLMIFGAAPAAGLAGIEIPALNFTSVKANAASITSEDGMFNYTLNSNNQATITGCNDKEAVSLTLGTVDGYEIVGIGNNAFKEFELLEEVVLADSIISIGDSAFYGCIKLEELTIPAKVDNIGGSAFNGCKKLYKVDFKDRETKQKLKIGGSAFRNCSNLHSINLEKSNVSTIDMYAFCNCTSLEQIIMPDTLYKAGAAAFRNCKSLNEVRLSDNLEALEYGFANLDGFFEGCTSLEKIEIPSGLQRIESEAFYGCDSLTEVIFKERDVSDTLTIGEEAFSDCKKLSKINLEDSNVKEIGYLAFVNCKSISEIIIPDTCISIDGGLFEYCTSLQKVTIGKNIQKIVNFGLRYTFKGCINLKSVVFSKGTKLDYIASSSFSGCDSLEYFDFYGTEEQWNKIENNDSSISNPLRIENHDDYIRIIFKESAPASFTLTYNANGGSGAPAAQTGSGSITLSAVKPVRSGYIFKGWAQSSSATSAQYQPGETYNLAANTVLYAVWEKEEVRPVPATRIAIKGSNAKAAKNKIEEWI